MTSPRPDSMLAGRHHPSNEACATMGQPLAVVPYAPALSLQVYPTSVPVAGGVGASGLHHPGFELPIPDQVPRDRAAGRCRVAPSRTRACLGGGRDVPYSPDLTGGECRG